ncbi:MAG TPA: uroporphyrinogen-III synthase [Puia sp.]|jgi:uroporphyrinogen-III synthase
MPDPTIHILSTRPLAKALLDQATTHGIAIEALSFIETIPIIDATLTQRILDLSTRRITAVFTSMNAVEAVAQHLQLPAGPPSPTGPLPPWQIFCIGSATRDLVTSHFGEDKIGGTAPSAKALAATIISYHPAEVFFYCGDQRRDELPDQLTKASIKVNELIVYHTSPTPHKLESIYDGIVFFSPSAVHSFFSVNAIPPTSILFAIGATTAEAIRPYSSNRTILSTTPEKEALIRQAIDYFQTDNIYY